MTRRIVVEIEADGTEDFIGGITGYVMGKIDANCKFSISQEILPEKVPEKKELQIPAFLQRCVSGQERGMRESLYGPERSVSLDG